jgi:DNA-binding NarL/FixJ family response regulator
MHPWMLKPDLKRPISLTNGNGTTARNNSPHTAVPTERIQASGSTPARRNGTLPTSGSEVRRTNGSRISIVIADDHPITLAGLDSLFSRESDFMVVSRCSDPHEAIKAVTAYQPDVLVVDQEMPVMDGLSVVKHLRRVRPETRIILLATKADNSLSEALQVGVQGVVYKNVDPRQLTRCVREVYAGRKWLDPTLTSQLTEKPGRGPVLDSLTRRQFEVARAAVSGLSNKELAQQLGVSEGTIKNHLHAIYERLNVDGRLALLLYLKEKALA